MLSPCCPCLRFMLNPLQAASSFACDGCGHHASFHNLRNPNEEEPELEIVEERRMVVNGSSNGHGNGKAIMNGSFSGNGSGRKRSSTVAGRILGRGQEQDEEDGEGEREGQMVKRSRN